MSRGSDAWSVSTQVRGNETYFLFRISTTSNVTWLVQHAPSGQIALHLDGISLFFSPLLTCASSHTRRGGAKDVKLGCTRRSFIYPLPPRPFLGEGYNTLHTALIHRSELGRCLCHPLSRNSYPASLGPMLAQKPV